MRNAYLLVTAGLLLMLSACTREQGDPTASSDGYYTCPMHPSVSSETPGSCPVCNMSLIKVERHNSGGEGHEGNALMLDKGQQELAGIVTDTVDYRILAPNTSVLGTVAIDEEQVRTINSRVTGRIDKLFIKSTGSSVRKGNPIYSIYSEQLLADEKEYLALLKNFSSDAALAGELIKASRNKLLLYGLTAEQITTLEETSVASPLITFFSPESGYVTEVGVTEGSYVSEGSPILKISRLHEVWVEAQLYANEIAEFSKYTAFNVYAEANPAEVYKGVLVFNNPLIEEGRRIHLLRLRVDNAKGKLIPGMMVSVTAYSVPSPVLTIPRSALLLEKMKSVWIKTGSEMFEQRMVETGVENRYWVEITSGLKQGDIVVSDGAYLLNSEFILKKGAEQRHQH